MNRHIAQYRKEFGRITTGTKHQLLADRTVTRDCKTRLTSMCTSWIDYRNTYDSVSNTWT